MIKPIIGITADYPDGKPAYHSGFGYVDAVVAAGGVPLILPFRVSHADISRIVGMLDGILFSGGNDLDPAAWGESYHPNALPVLPEREAYERALLAEVEQRRMPTLGICLGSQLMNVTRGGSMRQFIPDLDLSPRIEHRRVDGKDSRHGLTIAADSLLERTLGTHKLEANSAHKQAYGDIGRNLRIVAAAPDGVPEALEDPSMPLFLGVQWHPERIHQEGPHGAIFSLLVRKASEGAGKVRRRRAEDAS